MVLGLLSRVAIELDRPEMLRALLPSLLLGAALGQTITCSTEGSSYTWSETTSATTRTITTK